MWPLLLSFACHAPVEADGDSAPPAHDTAADVPEAPFVNEIVPFVSGGPDVIELYNPSDAEVDLTGAVLESIDANVQEAWPFPYGTTIGPGEHLVVYCDEYEFGSKGLHASFRLAREGGDVLFIYPWEGSMAVDRVTYASMAYDASYARVPDGGAWYVLPASSPGHANGHLVEAAVIGAVDSDGRVSTEGMETNDCQDSPPTVAVAELDLGELDLSTAPDPSYVSLFVAVEGDTNGASVTFYSGDGQVDASDAEVQGSLAWTFWWTSSAGWGLWAEVRRDARWLGLRVERSVCMPDPLVVTGVTMAAPR